SGASGGSFYIDAIGGDVAATDLNLTASGDITVSLSGGGGIFVGGTLQGSSGGFILLNDDGTGATIQGNSIVLDAIGILGNTNFIENTISFTSAGETNVQGSLNATDSVNLTAG